MFKLGELDRWKPVGKAPIRFLTDQPRPVRIEVNAEDETKLFCSYGKERHFLGIFEGYDVVSFEVPGMFEISSNGGTCKIWTPEMDTLAVEIPEAVSFTRAMNRAQRNPELELMMQKVTDTMERRIAQVTQDVTLRMSAERRAELDEVRREAAAKLREAKAERDADALASQLAAREDESAEA